MEPPHSITANPLTQPLGIRLLLWLAIGRALGPPIDAILESQEIQMRAAKRSLAGRQLPLAIGERLRLADLAQSIGPTIGKHFAWFLQPASLIRWLKRYQERQAQGLGEEPPPKQPGRPPVRQETAEAVVTIYQAGCTGLKRIQGELRKVGLHAARSTIRRILEQHGLPPGSNRTGQSWATFWRNHAPELVGIDFIQIATGVLGKVCYRFALVAIEHDTRRVHLLGLTDHPTDRWLRNVVRSATMEGAPLANRKYWISDNDGKFQTLTKILRDRGKEHVRTAVGAPDMNAFIERWIRSAREECLDHIVFLNEDQLRRVLGEYIEHHNTERPHQGLGNVTVGPWQAQTEGEIVCDQRLGGLLNSFRRAA